MNTIRNTIYLIIAEIAVVFISFLIFSAVIPGDKRHKVWEKFISSLSTFVIYVFIISAATTAITAYVVYTMRRERYLNSIAAIVQSVFVGFVVSCVPRRGAGDKKKV